MPALSHADHRRSPPALDIPRDYNAAADLIGRNLAAGRGDKIAYIDDAGSYSFSALDRRTSQFANLLRKLGVEPEQRVLVCAHDTIDFPTVFLGAIKAGVVPVAVNTLLTAADYQYMLADSRARIAIVSEPLLPTFDALRPKLPHLRRILVADPGASGPDALAAAIAGMPTETAIAPTTKDDACFWLYSSGSTGAPKGAVHVHSSLIETAELYAVPVLGIEERDVVFSAAKLFFAYGLGNGLSFPLAVGATTVLMAERPTPAAVARRLRERQPTIFYGVPTLYAAMLASDDLPQRGEVAIRRCASAGEALPEQIAKRWAEHFGVDILDGIGSTEMLHIFLSNRPDDVRYGTTGKAVPGYELRIVDDEGRPTPKGELGELQIKGTTAATMYWNNRPKTRTTFVGEWTRSGDKYRVDDDGYYVYGGRSDDMLKVSGIYVSPVEVESALISHPAVLEAAVIGREDEDRLTKPAAYVVLKPGHARSDTLAEELGQFVKAKLAPYKYPRWVSFVDELPKTATGKIQRFKLRAQVAG